MRKSRERSVERKPGESYGKMGTVEKPVVHVTQNFGPLVLGSVCMCSS